MRISFPTPHTPTPHRPCGRPSPQAVGLRASSGPYDPGGIGMDHYMYIPIHREYYTCIYIHIYYIYNIYIYMHIYYIFDIIYYLSGEKYIAPYRIAVTPSWIASVLDLAFLLWGRACPRHNRTPVTKKYWLPPPPGSRALIKPPRAALGSGASCPFVVMMHECSPAK